MIFEISRLAFSSFISLSSISLYVTLNPQYPQKKLHDSFVAPPLVVQCSALQLGHHLTEIQ